MLLLKKLENEAKQHMLRKMNGSASRMMSKPSVRGARHGGVSTADAFASQMPKVEVPSANTIERFAKRIRN